MRILTACLLLPLATPAWAQQQQSSALDRISASLGQCVGNFERQRDEMAALQKQLAEAQEKIKQMEAGEGHR